MSKRCGVICIEDLEPGAPISIRKTLEGEQLRLLLARTFNSTGTNYTFIGMNPSTATALDSTDNGGDRTTEKICELFVPDNTGPTIRQKLNVDEAGTVFIVNLVPIINSKSIKTREHWNSLSPEIKQTLLEVNRKYVEFALAAADIVIPIWGAPESWKNKALSFIRPALKTERIQDKRMVAVPNEKGSPRHPMFTPWQPELLEPFSIENGFSRLYD
ncbi:MAG: DUF1643 domain-containing protein [Bowdeniella nasicola]|nr:DUF1643 domain-containing protein [Bowdeniella nasicola]